MLSMRFATPVEPEDEWQEVLGAKVDQVLAGRGHARSGAVSWNLPPWDHYLNGTSGPPGYVDVAFDVVRSDGGATAAIDWRHVLKLYMELVVAEEGITFTSGADTASHMSRPTFTEAELAALLEVADEVRPAHESPR